MKAGSFILFILLVLPLLFYSQRVSNIHFEQVGKQIHIFYDLEGNQEYTVQVFCNIGNGENWGKPLQEVSGAIGENQKPGTRKMIIWNVLAEREKLSGNVRFRIEVVNAGTYTDMRDGQTYKWVKIGEQTWMAENLNYNSGKSWCYDNNANNCNKYGSLYNWEDASTACPDGWHLPTDEEWKTLEMHLGMSQSEADGRGSRGTDEGSKLKEAGTAYWDLPNTGATNSSGFTALPGGYRYSSGSFRYLGSYGDWWSSSESSGTTAWTRALLYGSSGKVYRGSSDEAHGFSVRCLKN